MVQGSLHGTIKDPVSKVPARDGKRSNPLGIDLFLVGFLCLLEILTFAPFLSKVGFYLDDWLMLQTLHFGPQNLLGAFGNYFFNDPKVIIRPVEVLHFAPMYFAFGLRPLGYHLVNGALEIVCICLLYKALKRLSESRLLAFLAVAAFIVYPIHDCTHYWILCSSVTLSAALYLLSLLASMKALMESKPYFHWLSALAFTFSIYNYEVFLPFAVVTFLCVFFMARRSVSFTQSLKQAAFSFLPLFASGVSLFAYQRYVVPHMGLGFVHKVNLDPLHILHVLFSGIFVSSPFNTVPFLQSQLAMRLSEPFSAVDILSLVVIFVGLSFLIFRLMERESLTVKPVRALEFAIIGVATTVFSILIFALSSEFEPTLATLVNRIFCGAAIGWGCVFAALVFLLARCLASQQIAKALISFCLSLSCVYFTVANWALAQPWVVSHRAQTGVCWVVSQQKGKIHHPDTLMLADCPRYVMWSPVFDGVWDFQSMVRLCLEDQKIAAGVVSDRLSLSDTELKDVSMGYTCGVYPYEHLQILVASHRAFLPARTGTEFVSIIEKLPGHSRLPDGTLDKWRQQLASAEARRQKDTEK